MAESSLNIAERNIIFARAELTEKTGEDLVLEDPALARRIFNVSTIGAGYVRQLAPLGSIVPAIGVSGGVSFVPRDLERFYGTHTPVSFAVFVSARPKPMEMHAMGSMQHGGDAQ